MPELGWPKKVVSEKTDIDLDEYLDRLDIWLGLQEKLGAISEEYSIRLLKATEQTFREFEQQRSLVPWAGREAFFPQSAPFLKQIDVPQWQWQQTLQKAYQDVATKTKRDVTERQKTQRTEISQRAEMQRYSERLLPLLNAQKNRGEITQQDIDTILEETQRQVRLGVGVKDLPLSEEVEQYWSGVESFGGGVVQFGKQPTGQELAKQQAVQFAGTQAPTGFGPRMKQAREFEEQRQQALGELSTPFDWIRRWQAQHKVNPFELSEEEMLEEELTSAERAAAPFGQDLTRPWNLAPGFEERAFDVQQRLAGAQEDIRHFQPDYTRPPEFPATPKWLAPFTGIEAGQQISRAGETLTPSGQLWNRLLPSQRERFAGYLDWRGGEGFADVQQRMASMLPRSPFGRRSQWTPSRQRA